MFRCWYPLLDSKTGLCKLFLQKARSSALWLIFLLQPLSSAIVVRKQPEIICKQMSMAMFQNFTYKNLLGRKWPGRHSLPTPSLSSWGRRLSSYCFLISSTRHNALGKPSVNVWWRNKCQHLMVKNNNQTHYAKMIYKLFTLKHLNWNKVFFFF